MVLRRRILSVLGAVLLASCLPKTAPRANLAGPAVLSVVAPEADPGAQAALTSVLEGKLSARGAQVSTSSEAAPRFEDLAEGVPADALVVQVATRIHFFSQLSGQYRWTVDTRIVLAAAAEPDNQTVSEVRVPVFLPFHHQRESEALVAAIPVIERELAAMLDGRR
jgi:hypothetical protein